MFLLFLAAIILHASAESHGPSLVQKGQPNLGFKNCLEGFRLGCGLQEMQELYGCPRFRPRAKVAMAPNECLRQAT